LLRKGFQYFTPGFRRIDGPSLQQCRKCFPLLPPSILTSFIIIPLVQWLRSAGKRREAERREKPLLGWRNE